MKASSALKKLQITKGDVVQVIMPNNCYYYFPVFAAWLIGAKVSVSDPGKYKLLIISKR
jgi:acyl-coenzyme A synthetase/AMP-(fatty) acid ligase